MGEDRLEPTVLTLDPRQQIAGVVGILDIGGMDENTEQEAGGIDRDVTHRSRSFNDPSLDPLGRIVAARPPFSVVLTVRVSRMGTAELGSRPSSRGSVSR